MRYHRLSLFITLIVSAGVSAKALAGPLSGPQRTGLSVVKTSDCVGDFCVVVEAEHAQLSHFARSLAAPHAELTTVRGSVTVRRYRCQDLVLDFAGHSVHCDLADGRELWIDLRAGREDIIDLRKAGAY